MRRLLCLLPALCLIFFGCSSDKTGNGAGIEPEFDSGSGGSAGKGGNDGGTAGNDSGSAGKPGDDSGTIQDSSVQDCGVDDGSIVQDGCVPPDTGIADASSEASVDAGFWNGQALGWACPPAPADGYHSQGEECLSCHNGTVGPAFIFGGTVYQPDGITGASGVEFGLRDPSGLYLACSGSNGNFWIMGSQKIDFANAQLRMRTAKGEATMKTKATGACNKCHATSKIIKP